MNICGFHIFQQGICLKDPSPLPNIDGLVNDTSGLRTLSFMDTYFRYNHISMNLINTLKISFMMNQSNYYYDNMPFGFKNAKAAYQRLMDTMSSDQIC